jgi:diguanylate cyclase (GGDEF)-like protein
VAGTLRSTIRGADFFGRFGGEEFLFILPHQDAHGATLAAERLRRKIAETEVVGGRLKVTVSIGVASLTEKGMQDMLLRADRALYAAKGAGRNRVATDPPQ